MSENSQYVVRVFDITKNIVYGTHLVGVINVYTHVNIGDVGHWNIKTFNQLYSPATKLHILLSGAEYDGLV